MEKVSTEIIIERGHKWNAWRKRQSKKMDLSGADLQDLRFCGFDFSNALIKGVNFKGSSFILCHFDGSTLENSNFENTDFSGCFFKGASLKNANFTNALFEGVEVYRNTNLINAIFTNCEIKTFPDGSGQNLVQKFLKYLTPEQRQQLKQKKSCFVVTAACGNEYSWQVICLQRFRDTVLMSSSFGRYLIDLYYDKAPPLANLISKYRILRLLFYYTIISPLAIFVSQLLKSETRKITSSTPISKKGCRDTLKDRQ